jgi:flagellar biosynthetic protein FlhB
LSTDTGERNLPATPQKIKEARKKGQIGRSQDLSAWVGLGASALMLAAVVGTARAAATDQFTTVAQIAQRPDAALAQQALGDGLRSIIGIIGPMLAVVFAVVFATSAAQGGIHPQKPRFHTQQFNPANGFKRMFGKQAAWQATKTLLKSAVVGIAVFAVIQGLTPLLLSSGSHTLSGLLGVAGPTVRQVITWGVSAGIGIALIDLVTVLRRNRKHTRMTLKEAKDENKRTEGDPIIKSARRSRQMALSRNRMMSEVSKADAVIVNPTHVAVALRYVPGTGAPRVVAKGKGAIATAIRKRAVEHRVALIEDVPLARALHAACELGQEIPEHLFSAVAKVLAFVMNLRRRGVTPSDRPRTL